MRAYTKFLATSLACVAACTGTQAPIVAEMPVIEQATIETMADGRCFTFAPGPTRTETVVVTVQTAPEQRDASGAITQPAIVRSEEREQIVPAGPDVRFEVVCPQNLTQGLVASVQRALSARGAYAGPVNGLLDAGTQKAILVFQSRNGLQSGTLSIATAREFGLTR